MSQSILKNKNIALCVSGGIAAYKAAELLREFQKAGAIVRVIMTKNATRFVGTLTFEALSGQPVFTDMFDKGDASIWHISWAEEADLVVVAPATANVIAKFAQGIADDTLSTFMLAARSPILICPAMNTRMWENIAVQSNLEILRARGFEIMLPDAGELACRTIGAGRLPDPCNIFDRASKLMTPKDFSGKRLLVSAGPTREFIDPVRFISNPSSGKMGYAIAKAAEYRGAKVTLVSGPVSLPSPQNVEIVRVQSVREMAEAMYSRFEESDIVIKSAAVGDYKVDNPAHQKIKKSDDTLSLLLVKNEDILKELGQRKSRQILVGFAAETQDLEKNASKKLAEKNLEMIVGNLIGPADSGFGAESNRVNLFYKDGTKESLPLMSKEAVARIILDRIKEKFINK